MTTNAFGVQDPAFQELLAFDTETLNKIHIFDYEAGGLIENATAVQALNVAALPFVKPFVALMPDAHVGKGATIGSVIPTTNAVIPAAVGVDIGCGVYAARLGVTMLDVHTDKEALLQAMRAAVPLGSGKTWGTLPEPVERNVGAVRDAIVGARGDRAWEDRMVHQLGTLGGGNHFIELAENINDNQEYWLLIHSGSRGSGHSIAQWYIDYAKELCADWNIPLKDPDLAYLPTKRGEGQDYLAEMEWAVKYAAANRAVMGELVVANLRKVIGPFEVLEIFDVPHNYTRREQIGKHPAWVTRKGAISARLGERGIIPGSMGTASYIVTGKGNMKGLQSAPHGAGRPRSRTATRKMYNMDSLILETMGVAMEHSESIIDELPSAYKPIDQVMAAADELISIERVLAPVINVKGGK